jgi:luciferase family oxidoreductase group 1
VTPLSILDLSPIVQGGSAAQALSNSLDLARHAEAWGYRRFWVAEHHNMPGVASAATAVVVGHVAAGTTTIRVGSGGIMLPNHSPLVIAEQFGTLESLFPGRIDLGLGRAPGTDPVTAHALRRDLTAGEENFPRDVVELQAYLAPTQPGQLVRPYPAPDRTCRSGSSARVSSARSSRRTSGCRSRSRRTSRRITCSTPWPLYRTRFKPTSALASPVRDGRRRAASPRKPMTKPDGC